MSKIDYAKINWDAQTNWNFCGNYANLREMWNRYWSHVGIRTPIEEFGYKFPCKGLAFEKGDVVKYTPANGEPMLGVVDAPVNSSGWFSVRLSNGDVMNIHPNDLGKRLVRAAIPDELMALARVEVAATTVDLSKCPLKKAGVCMETE